MAETAAKKAASSDAQTPEKLTKAQTGGAVDLGPLVARDEDASVKELSWAEQAYPELTSEEQAAIEDQRQTTIAEYSQYVATQPIYYGGARAHNVDDPVPASNVNKYGLLERGLVKKVEA